MARDIVTRFKLEGEAEYRRAMQDAANSVKVLDSELKLADAQFKATGDAEQYVAEQTRILQEEIQAQKGAVAAAEQAMKALADNGVSKNDRTYQTWAKRLNDAKTNLTNLETKLGNVDESLDTSTKKADATSEAIQGIGANVNYEVIKEAIRDVTRTIETVVKAAARAAKAVWEMGVDAGTWADDLATAASKAGVDVETYQSWQYASRFIDTSVDDISKSILKMEADLGNGSEETAKIFNQLGVATRNADGSVRDATATFWDTIDALGRVTDETQRGIYAQKLLGSHYNSLNPLIEAGSKAYKDLAEEGMKYAVVSEENVQQLGSFNDKYEEFNATLNKTKMDTLAELSPTFEKVADAMTKALQALDDFVQSEEGQAALQGLSEALSGIIDAFLGEDNGAGTFASIVDTAKGAVEDFTTALTWIKDNGNTIADSIKLIAGVWAGLKVAPSVLTLLQLIKMIPTSKLTSLVSGGGGTEAAGSAAEAAGAAASSGGVSALRAGAARTASGLTAAAAKAEGLALAAMAVEAGVNMVNEVKEQGTLLGIGQRDQNGDILLGGSGIALDMEKINQVRDWMANFAQNAQAKYRENADAVPESVAQLDALITQSETARQSVIETRDLASDAMDDILAMQEALDEAPGENIEALYQLIDKLTGNAGVIGALSKDTQEMARAYKDELSGFGAGSNNQFADAQTLLDQMLKDLTAAYEQAAKEAQEKGAEIGTNTAEGLAGTSGEAASAADTVGAAANDAAEQEMSFLEVIGYNGGTGLANGLYDAAPEVEAAAQFLADTAQATIQSALDIRSPSKVMAQMGRFTAQGFASGIDEGARQVENAVDRMTGLVGRGVRGDAGAYAAWNLPPAAAAAGSRDSGSQINATIVMDKRVVGSLVAPVVNDVIGATVEAARR